jgi:hypothetical protein
MRLHYKHQLVHEVKGNNLCLLRETHESHKHKNVGKMHSTLMLKKTIHLGLVTTVL